MNSIKTCLIALILCAAPAAWADSSVPTAPPDPALKDSIFVNIGGTTPINPSGFTSGQTLGYNGGVAFGFGLSNLTQLVIDANADNFPLNSGNFPGYSGGNLRVGTLLANARFRFLAQDNPVVPYIIGGMGFARVDQDALSAGGVILSPAASSTNFAARFGIGIDIRLDKMTALFIESDGYGISGSNGGSNFSYNSFRFGGKFNL